MTSTITVRWDRQVLSSFVINDKQQVVPWIEFNHTARAGDAHVTFEQTIRFDSAAIKIEWKASDKVRGSTSAKKKSKSKRIRKWWKRYETRLDPYLSQSCLAWALSTNCVSRWISNRRRLRLGRLHGRRRRPSTPGSLRIIRLKKRFIIRSITSISRFEQVHVRLPITLAREFTHDDLNECFEIIHPDYQCGRCHD